MVEKSREVRESILIPDFRRLCFITLTSEPESIRKFAFSPIISGTFNETIGETPISLHGFVGDKLEIFPGFDACLGSDSAPRLIAESFSSLKLGQLEQIL